MAWSAPATPWTTVGEIMTSAKMNILADDVRYLKGLAGAVAIEDALGVTVNTNTANGMTITNSNAGASAYAGLNLENDGGVDAGVYRNSSANTSYGGANSLNFLTIGAHSLSIGTNNTVRQFFDSTGRIGFNTTNPQSILHANGAGGGFMFLSCDAVGGTLQTPVVAGTVTQSAAFWVYDRYNTGATLLQVSGNMLALGGSFGFVGADTVTVTVTAGGAITVQRTSGSTATHQINGFVVFK